MEDSIYIYKKADKIKKDAYVIILVKIKSLLVIMDNVKQIQMNMISACRSVSFFSFCIVTFCIEQPQLKKLLICTPLLVLCILDAIYIFNESDLTF